MDKRNIIRKVRLTPEEDALFKRKAARYKTVSAMVRDAVAQFDDTATRGKVKALREMTALYHEYEQDLSWLGGNFNQTMKRANELAIAQELTHSSSSRFSIRKSLNCDSSLTTSSGSNIT